MFQFRRITFTYSKSETNVIYATNPPYHRERIAKITMRQKGRQGTCEKRGHVKMKKGKTP